LTAHSSLTLDSVNVTFHITAQPNNIVVKDFDFGTCVARRRVS
jgi:hypothetical protein